MAAMFAPWTPAMARMAQGLKSVTASTGDLFRDHSGLAKVTTAFIGLAAAAGLAYAGIHGWKALVSAGGVLAGLKGLGLSLFGGATNLAKGVAEGKALQAAAGVTPVFVTNFPAGMGLGGAVGAVGAGMILDKWGKPIASAAAGAALSRGAGLLKPALAALPMPNMFAAGAVASAGVAGYTVGKYAVAPLVDYTADKTGFTPWQWLTDAFARYAEKAAYHEKISNHVAIALNIDQAGRIVVNADPASSVEVSNSTARGIH